MNRIDKESLREYLKTRDVLTPKKYIIYGTYLTAILGLVLQFLGFGLSNIKYLNYPIKILIGIVVAFGIYSLFVIGKKPYFLFLYKSIIAYYFSIMCLSANIGIYSSFQKDSLVNYALLILLMSVIATLISLFIHYKLIRSKTKKVGKKKIVFETGFATIGIWGMLIGSYIARQNTQAANIIIVFVSTLIIGLVLSYAGSNSMYKYILSQRNK